MPKPRHGAAPYVRPCATLCFALCLHVQIGLASNPIQVEQAWLDRNCLDKGNADRPLRGEAFEACLKKKVEGLPPLDTSRREFFGERYNPAQYVKCRLSPNGRNNSACDVYILRRREWPEYWPEGSRRIKWPDPPKQSIYKLGMTPKEHWEALCRADAGEFIYETVRGIDGFLIVRPRGPETDLATKDGYAIEDAYGFHESQFGSHLDRPGKYFFRLMGENYIYVETGTHGSAKAKWLRHQIDAPAFDFLLQRRPEKWREEEFTTVMEVDAPKSLYGITWRGVRRAHDLESRISGGELAIFDLRSGKILALRRGYAVDGFAVRSITGRHSWLGSWGCPTMARDSTSLREFVQKVLVPTARHQPNPR